MYLLTPTAWNPHNNAYAANEARMLDWQGQLVNKEYRQRILISDIPDDTNMSAAMEIGLVESNVVSNILNNDLDEHVVLCNNITREADQV